MGYDYATIEPTVTKQFNHSSVISVLPFSSSVFWYTLILIDANEAMSKLTVAVDTTPVHREQLWRSVKYYATVMHLLFGHTWLRYCPCPASPSFLGQVVPFRHYHPNQFWALFWKYHGKPTESFNNLLAQWGQGVPIYADEVPQEGIVASRSPQTTANDTSAKQTGRASTEPTSDRPY